MGFVLLIIHAMKWSMQWQKNAPYIHFIGVMKVNFALWLLELLSRHCMAFSALVNLVKKYQWEIRLGQTRNELVKLNVSFGYVIGSN